MEREPPPLPESDPPPIEDTVAARARDLGLGRWPDVMSDLAAGRGLAAHARLLRLRRAARSQSDRDAIDAALSRRRLFAEPVGKPPGLGRLNGFGAGMYGGSDRDPDDGSYVKTRSASAFWIPVFPIDQWLVRDAEGGGWYFLARVPVDRAMLRARLVAYALAALAGAVAMVIAAWSSSHADLHVLNGLDVPAELTIDGATTVTVAPGGRETCVVSAGKHRFRCVVAGRVVDEREESVSGTADLVAYNVAGSAPLLVENVVYHADGAPESGGPKSDPVSFGGTVFCVRKEVAHAFEDPPKSVKVRTGERYEVRTRALVLDGGWRAAIEVTAHLRGPQAAALVAEGLALAVPGDEAVVAEATDLSRSNRPAEDHAKFLERLAAARAEPAGGPR